MPLSIAVLCLALLPAGASALDWARDPVAQMRFQLAQLPPVSVPPASAVEAPATAPERLECRPEMIAAFKTIWRMAGSGREDYEAAFRADPAEDKFAIEYMPMTRTPYQLPVHYSLATTAAIAHTHPDTAEATPGPGDYASKVPNFVISRDALYVTIPGTKRHRFVRRNWAEACAAAR